MAEYTYEDIIMDPEDPRLEGAIGKECFFSEYPKRLLNSAKNNSPEYLDCLTDIRKEGACTFVDKNGSAWTLIIIKKEEPKPKYIPFESADEFIDVYDSKNFSVQSGTIENKLLYYGGIWLKDKDIDGVFYMVTEIWRDGVVLGSDQSTTKWDDLLYGYTFIDGSPCGKEVEMKQISKAID